MKHRRFRGSSSSRSGRGGRRELDRAQRISAFLDDTYIDPLLGFFFPGIGDLVGSTFGLYTVGIAIQRGLSPVIIARMLINLALDSLIGLIPILGDLFDAWFKAHKRNLALMDARFEHRRAAGSDWLYVGVAIVAVIAAIGIPIWVTVRLLQWIF